MKKIILFIFCLGYLTSFGQNEEFDNVDEQDNIRTVGFDLRDRLFLNVSNSYFIDFITSPLGTAFIQNARIDSNGNTFFIQEPVAAKTSYQSIFTVGFEPRLNMIQLKENLALAVSAPIAIGFGNAFAADQARGATGLGHIQIPLLLKLYSGAASTYEAKDDFGISAGIGLEMNKLGLFQFSATEEERELSKAWVMPSASLGVHFYRGFNPMEVNIKYGFGPIETQRINDVGDPIFPELITRASSLRLSFVYMLGS